MANIIYNVFLKLFATAFRIAAIFNSKARLGVAGRKNSWSKIRSILTKPNQQLVWMHCASLGEFEQGRPVLESLKLQYPDISIALTFFSASGYEVMKDYKGADYIFYLPLDSSSNAKKIVCALNPTLVLWVKYEFWHYYLLELKRNNIPVLLVSGIFRPTNPFFKWYGKIWRKMLLHFAQIFVQDETSKALLNEIGIFENIIVAGDTRFDRVIEIAGKFEPLHLIRNFCANSKVLVAGSTWEDDEAELTHYTRANPNIKFILAPHEVDKENLKDVKKQFTNAVFLSELLKDSEKATGDDLGNQLAQQPTNNTEHVQPNVLIIDNVGMLSRLYHYADITYVGGGFGAGGVHNVLEAAVYGKPVVYGPEFEKYSEAIGLVECGGGIPVKNALELESILNELWNDKVLLFEKGAAAKNYVFTNAGATEKVMQYIQEKRLLTN